MFRHELSPFLQRVLDAVDRLPNGVMVDAQFEPSQSQIGTLAVALGEDAEDVRGALLGLRAGDCLVQIGLDIPGIEPVYVWKVHPQCAGSANQDGR